MAKEPRTPVYPARPHRSGQARIRLGGRDVYLGAHGSEASHAEYRRVVAEYLAAGGVHRPRSPLTVAELVLAYWAWAKGYYVEDGEPTSEQRLIKKALAYLGRLYADTPAAQFGPLALQAVRQSMVDAGLCRHTCNQYTSRVKAAFRWGVEQELVPASVHQGLQAVRGLRAGRTPARDNPPVQPAPPADVAAAVAHAREPVRTMIQVQQLSGMRPGEVCRLRGDQIDRTCEPWEYAPAKHKTRYRGKKRFVFFGPKCRQLLAPLLAAHGDGPLFYTYQGRPFPPDANSYRKAIAAACRRAGVPEWAPNRLRHSALTEARRLGGLEAAQQFAGHEHMSTTEIYAEPDLDLARLVAEEMA